MLRKKLILIVLFVSILFYAKRIYSAPCYGPHMPKEKSFVIGVQSHTILKRYLEDEFGKIRSLQNFILLSYGIRDWLCLDLKGGSGYIKQHPLNKDELDYSTGFAGGYGFRLRLYDQNNKKIIFGFQHISAHPKKVSSDNQKNEAILDDWQSSLLFSCEIMKFSPYIGTKYSRLDYIHRWDGQRKRRNSDLTKSLGLILGLDFNIDGRYWVNLETQFFDVEAFSLSINFSF
ncbi:MAG: hypothetical protein NC900_05825 [Candidatus Omnitrophica bacterium]|nr:hypothetical protein [Candidatus Omnitrophota bacterium]MCM8800222.1 hypothetical protein [Candidatus Omnitrophota bacterium]